MGAINFYLNVCETMQSNVDLDGQVYQPGHQGQVNIKHTIKSDVLFLELDWCGHRPHVGDAAHITAVSIRVCPDRISTIAVYDDPSMNVMGCCHSCDNGCTVYGSSGCSCG